VYPTVPRAYGNYAMLSFQHRYGPPNATVVIRARVAVAASPDTSTGAATASRRRPGHPGLPVRTDALASGASSELDASQACP
jgi:hypothetical protein